MKPNVARPAKKNLGDFYETNLPATSPKKKKNPRFSVQNENLGGKKNYSQPETKRQTRTVGLNIDLMESSSRLSSPNDFKIVYREGYRVSAGDLRLHILRRQGEGNRVGFSIRGRLKAVVRNRIKRRLREAYRLNQAQLKKGFDLVIVARESLKEKTFWEVERALRIALTKGRMWGSNDKNRSLDD